MSLQLFRRVGGKVTIAAELLLLLVTVPNSVERDEDTDVDRIESMLGGTESAT